MIRLIITDCDGVLTDGRLYFGPEGETLKVFNVKDGTAINALISKNIRIGVVSGRSSIALLRRAQELNLDFCEMGVENKSQVVKRLVRNFGFNRNEVLYIGDDTNDISAHDAVGVFCAVSDADESVREMADIVLQTPGGGGVFKEILKIVI